MMFWTNHYLFTYDGSTASTPRIGINDNSQITHAIIKSSPTTIVEDFFEGDQFPSLQSVYFETPSSIVVIEACAFHQSKHLKDIHVPPSLFILEDSAFEGCASLITLNLHHTSLTCLGDSIFRFCSSIKQITLPSTLTTCGYEAFFKCKSLERIELAHTHLTAIDESAFSGCTSLQYISLPPTVASLSDGAFLDCKSLTTIDLSNTQITEIGYHAFHDCISLQTILLPNFLSTICEYAFVNCISLNTLQFPTTCTILGASAFEKCTSLSFIHLHNSLEEIGPKCFYKCTSLKLIHVHDPSIIHPTAFESCPTFILLTNTHTHQSEYPTLNIRDVQSCIQDIPDGLIPSLQLTYLRRIFLARHPQAAVRADRTSQTLLHVLTRFVPDTKEQEMIITTLIQEILNKCPEAIHAMNSDGQTPLHSLVSQEEERGLPLHNVVKGEDEEGEHEKAHHNHRNMPAFQLLSNASDHNVLLKAIISKLTSWNIVKRIVLSKVSSLYVKESDCGLYPFMIAAMYPMSDLNISYELLLLQPDILQQIC